MIPLVKPFLPIRQIQRDIHKVLKSGQIAFGDYVKSFEVEFGNLIGNPLCVAVNSGTSALHLAMIVIGIRKGDEVISTALTAEPTNTVIINSGAKVVFADVDYSTGLISPDSIEARITKNTKAIMVVHYAGMVCDMDKINAISNKYNIPVIEDAAHAFLAKYRGKYLGSNSRFTCFSFQAIKHLTTIDGGMLCLTNDSDYQRVKKLRWFGLDREVSRLENDITEVGYKYNMNNISAAIGLVQLRNLRKNVHKYIENGRYFDLQLQDIDGIALIPYYPNTVPSYWLYTVKVRERNSFIEYFYKNGIIASPLHKRNDSHSVFKVEDGTLINLDRFYEEFVHIPCGWWINNRIRNKIVNLAKSRGWL